MNLFLPHHYAAFNDPKPERDDPAVVAERVQVRDALLELDSMLWPRIEAARWDLHRHRQPNHYVSSDHFVYLEDGTPIVQYIDGMWLHYGKSPEQLDFLKTIGGFDYSLRDVNEYFNAFYLHTRIQFYLNASVFRCWLLLATDKNYYDRSEFLRRLNADQTERDAFYQLVIPLLGQGFHYHVADDTLPLITGLTQNQLIRFVRHDRGGYYSGIFKEYKPDDPELDRARIGAEMWRNMELLYPLYDFMAWRPPRIP
jgi:hypothetical protein